MIRATRPGFYDLIRRETTSQAAALQKAQAQAASGLRIERPSDDPVGSAAVQRLSAAVTDQDVWTQNAEEAISVHNIADQALSSVNDVLLRAREIAVAMASETNDATARASAAAEVQGLQDALLTAANTRYGDRYIFAGSNWSTPPYLIDGTYSGDTISPEARVGEDRWVQIGFDGSAIFQGSVDVFTTLSDLATALTANDVPGIQTALGDMVTATDQIASARGDVGVQTNVAEDARNVAENMKVVLGGRLSDLADVDPVEAYTRLNELMASYQATLQVAGSAATGSLLDYLR